MEKLLAAITELEAKVKTLEGEAKTQVEKELSAKREELSAAFKKVSVLEKENADLKEKGIDAELSAMVADGRLLETQKEIAKGFMVAGKSKEVNELFSKPNPMKPSAKPAGARVLGDHQFSKGEAKALIIPYSEFSEKPLADRLQIIKQMEDPNAKQQIIIADDFWGKTAGVVRGVSPFERFEASHKAEELSRNDDGMIELASYVGGVSQGLSGSNLLPKVWETKVVYDMGAMKYGFAAVTMKATVASALTIQWNLVGTTAAQGTNVDNGTNTGTTGITITPVTMSPQLYCNSVTWE